MHANRTNNIRGKLQTLTQTKVSEVESRIILTDDLIGGNSNHVLKLK